MKDCAKTRALRVVTTVLLLLAWAFSIALLGLSIHLISLHDRKVNALPSTTSQQLPSPLLFPPGHNYSQVSVTPAATQTISSLQFSPGLNLTGSAMSSSTTTIQSKNPTITDHSKLVAKLGLAIGIFGSAALTFPTAWSFIKTCADVHTHRGTPFNRWHGLLAWLVSVAIIAVTSSIVGYYSMWVEWAIDASEATEALTNLLCCAKSHAWLATVDCHSLLADWSSHSWVKSLLMCSDFVPTKTKQSHFSPHPSNPSIRISLTPRTHQTIKWEKQSLFYVELPILIWRVPNIGKVWLGQRSSNQLDSNLQTFSKASRLPCLSRWRQIREKWRYKESMQLLSEFL